MFTGIIQHLGVFRAYGRGRQELRLEAPVGFPDLPAGESVAVDGACLTLTKREGRELVFDLSQETLSKTHLGSLRPGERLNLEVPLTLQSLLSGHLLTGHVDGLGRVVSLTPKRPGKRLRVSFPRELRPYFVTKGSVAVNGVSLTIARLEPSFFETEIIPVTIGKSNLADLKRGQPVSLECDILGKYVYNWVCQFKK